MIKIKILNPHGSDAMDNFCDRNRDDFAKLYRVKDMLRDYSIDITESDDYDYLFVGMSDFIDKKVSLKRSIEKGLENLSKITGDYFLFDGSDSTSLMGSYEVFKESKAIYLFKNQLLKKREMYNTPYAFGKWFFGSGSDLDLAYDIPKDVWKRIKLSGHNIGYHSYENYLNFQPINTNKTVDVCAIYQAEHKYNEDHKVRNDLLYTNHRKGAWEHVQNLSNKYDVRTAKLPFQEYINLLHNSKVSISPMGMGEICFRDFECMTLGTMIVRPDMSWVNTTPNIYVDGETYISCKLDWSDLEEKIEYTIDNFNELNEKLIINIRKLYEGKYKLENLCMHWYSIFSELSGIEVNYD